MDSVTYEQVLYVNVNRNGDDWNVNVNPANASQWNAGNRVFKQLIGFLLTLVGSFCSPNLSSIHRAFDPLPAVVH